jgi:hypothetical protein
VVTGSPAFAGHDTNCFERCSQRVVLRPAARALCLDSTTRSFVNVAPWGCDLPTRRQPKHRVQIIRTPDRGSAREDVKGRAMSPTRSISHEDCARPIGALSWHWSRRSLSRQAGRGERRRLPSGMLEPYRGCRTYFTQDRLDIRQCPAVPGMRGRKRGASRAKSSNRASEPIHGGLS